MSRPQARLAVSLSNPEQIQVPEPALVRVRVPERAMVPAREEIHRSVILP